MDLQDQVANAHRIMAMLGFHEAIDGHISARTSLQSAEIFLTPYPKHWSEIERDDVPRVSLITGDVISGDYTIDIPAWSVHRPLHNLSKRHTVFIHAHPPEITTVACSERGRILPIHQSMLPLYNEISYFDDYDGEVLSEEYGNKIATALHGRSILILANHGVITAGGTVAKALKRMYYLECSCKIQNKVLSTHAAPSFLNSSLIPEPSNLVDDSQSDHSELLFNAWSRLCARHRS